MKTAIFLGAMMMATMTTAAADENKPVDTAAQCAANLAAGFVPGVYTGKATDREVGLDKSRNWATKELTLSIDTQGCMTWVGENSEGGAFPGEAPSSSFCGTAGDGAVVQTAKGLAFEGRIMQKGGADVGPATIHVWSCHGQEVRVRIGSDESAFPLNGCVRLGNDSDHMDAIACMYDQAWNDLHDAKISLQKDGSIRINTRLFYTRSLVLKNTGVPAPQPKPVVAEQSKPTPAPQPRIIYTHNL